MVTITGSAGAVTARLKLNVRRDAPSSASPRTRQIEAGQRFGVIGQANGQNVQGVALWYALGGNEFVWAGACDNFVAGPDPDADADGDRPSRAELGDYSPPNFETATGIRHKVQGKRPNGLEGMIVHFDAYRIRAAGNGAENSDSRSLDTLRGGQDNGFHYGIISRTGRVWLPEGFDWGDWGYHAGPSLCPVTQRTGVSQFYVGFEMNNPGKLFATADPGVFCPWFNVVVDKDKNPVLDSKGRATRRSATDEWYTSDQVRRASGGNIHDGWYLPYSHAQRETLTNIALYLAKRFSSFSLDRVLGHDEVAPTRKNDPGGALADPDQVMTMAEFRADLKSRL
ncbi:N-acetylmuramoyl-L-alanine amidase [Caulobacter ginsengisoli]|nr:N-acetylmuramoyl-L-alanine amidase [Caulobacter ginsengisoli]